MSETRIYGMASVDSDLRAELDKVKETLASCIERVRELQKRMECVEHEAEETDERVEVLEENDKAKSLSIAAIAADVHRVVDAISSRDLLIARVDRTLTLIAESEVFRSKVIA